MTYEADVRRGFAYKKINGVGLLTIPAFTEHGFSHCFTTRIGGVSKGAYGSLNLSRTRENNPGNKEENYRRVAAALGVAYGSLTLVNYAHGDGVYCAKPEDAGKGVSRETDFPRCDAIITDVPDVTGVTLHADCVPIFMADPKKRVAGVAHAGWKGTLMGIVPKMAAVLQARYGSDPEDLLVGIGPHIMACCFEVKEDVAGAFRSEYEAHIIDDDGGRLSIDLQGVLLGQLERAGVPAGNVTCADRCTFCDAELFYSHRRDKGNTGAMGSFIAV